MPRDNVISVRPLGFPWQTEDPFLFCVHHDDHYPSGNARLGPNAKLDGRQIGMDFEGRDGWRMYHGDVVPGFPQHPHRGFETVTVSRKGFIDHADSLGATARYGQGDVQWMTAGGGIVHAEMFPLLEQEKDNPLELFQIWLNLPRADKLVKPYFSMFWNQSVPKHVAKDSEGRKTEVTVVAGELFDQKAPAPPPNSWAARKEARVAIWSLVLEPNAKFTLPATDKGVNRNLYFFIGSSLTVEGVKLDPKVVAKVKPDQAAELVNGPATAEVLILQGKPIGEPVVQYGPFVMNTPEEIQKAFNDYHRTQFGGWPWDHNGPVHKRDSGRFAKHSDGRLEHANIAASFPAGHK
jgi:quercetin 2,3-dioxygenase